MNLHLQSEQLMLAKFEALYAKAEYKDQQIFYKKAIKQCKINLFLLTFGAIISNISTKFV